eukprot:TRINITY_DN223_c0_g1_i1.p1 TRINITY_DN223_c0_g1~~TRINITY_DN223_c0_g1_i1.p1  ORF type:complete len:230 (-),score=72.23 TRINITY_DN223_c0_g1_i1:91-741(-)
MMKAFALAILAVALPVALAQTPSKPVWPKAFSASVLEEFPGSPPHFDRLFWDSNLKCERRDGSRSFGPNQRPVRFESIVNFNERIDYEVFFERDQVQCHARPAYGNFTQPDFNQFTYVGRALIGQVVTNFWANQNKTRGTFFSYWEDAVSREPVRMDLLDKENRETRLTFMEFDAAPQDPALFILPDAIKATCTKPEPKMDAITMKVVDQKSVFKH